MPNYLHIFDTQTTSEKLSKNNSNTNLFWATFGPLQGAVNNKAQLPPWGYLGFSLNTESSNLSAVPKPPPRCPPPRCYTIVIENFIIKQPSIIIVTGSGSESGMTEYWESFPIVGDSEKLAFKPSGNNGNLENPVTITLINKLSKATESVLFDVKEIE